MVERSFEQGNDETVIAVLKQQANF
jgi:hypothetical protein